MENMVPIIKEIRTEFPEIPVLVNANAGMPQLHKGKTVFPESPEEMSGFIPEVINAGATMIGGCT